MVSISKELLFARLSYLEEIRNKPGSPPINPRVSTKMQELIEEGEITSYMALESVYSFLDEKLQEDESEVDNYAKEIISFLN